MLQAIWSSVLVLTGTYRALFTRVIYTEWIFFALMALGMLVLRRRPGYHPAWRMPLVPIAPLVFVAASLLIVVNQMCRRPRESAIGLALVVSGCRSTACGHAATRKAALDALPMNLSPEP